jgi:hypothetical protein
MELQPEGSVFDLVGPDQIDFVDIMHTIKKVKGLNTAIVRVPYWLFYLSLKVYEAFSRHPPFTTDQLKALTAGDHFTGVDMETTFGVKPTCFEDAVKETFCHPKYSKVVLKRND